jgi:DNA-binding NarL/FixJ family response regulator
VADLKVLVAENDELHAAFAVSVIVDLCGATVDLVCAVDEKSGVAAALAGDITYAVLDLQLPDGSGIEIARALWRRRPETQILFWSNFADEAYVRSLARIVPAGSNYGYLLKSASEGEMQAALDALFFKDRSVIHGEVRVLQHRVADRLAGLSDTEYEGLVDIALGLTDRVIAKRRRLSERGVQNRLRHIYEKLDIVPGEGREGVADVNSRTRAISIAFQRGLITLDVLRREQETLEVWLQREFGRPSGLKPSASITLPR